VRLLRLRACTVVAVCARVKFAPVRRSKMAIYRHYGEVIRRVAILVLLVKRRRQVKRKVKKADE
jgi:hypothetical protein